KEFSVRFEIVETIVAHGKGMRMIDAVFDAHIAADIVDITLQSAGPQHPELWTKCRDHHISFPYDHRVYVMGINPGETRPPDCSGVTQTFRRQPVTNDLVGAR